MCCFECGLQLSFVGKNSKEEKNSEELWELDVKKKSLQDLFIFSSGQVVSGVARHDRCDVS